MYSPHCIPIRGTLDTREKESRSYALLARATSGCTRAHPPSGARAWSETRAPRSALLFRTSGGGRPRAPRVGMRWPAWTMVAGAQTPRQSECESFHVLSFLHGNNMRFWFHSRGSKCSKTTMPHAPSATRARPRGAESQSVQCTYVSTRERKVRLSKSVDAGRLSSSDFLLNKLRTRVILYLGGIALRETGGALFIDFTGLRLMTPSPGSAFAWRD